MADNLFVRETSLYTGYGTFDLDKVTQIVKFFATKDENLFKLRLLKYLFYSDFLFFKRFSVSLSGLTYQRFPMGPVPRSEERRVGKACRCWRAPGHDVETS